MTKPKPPPVPIDKSPEPVYNDQLTEIYTELDALIKRRLTEGFAGEVIATVFMEHGARVLLQAVGPDEGLRRLVHLCHQFALYANGWHAGATPVNNSYH